MHSVMLLITITRRADAQRFIDFFHENGVNVLYSAVCRGTARQGTLDLLGLEQTEKTVHFAVVTRALARTLTRRLSSQMQIDLPDRGVAMAVPLTSIGGQTAMDFYLEGQPSPEQEAPAMQEQIKHELIVVISQTGYIDLVMDAARSAGASGGTVIHAKGTGGRRARQFYGVTIADEKDMVLLVVDSDKKKAIMRAVMQDAGAHTKARAVCFSLPVEATAGFKLIDSDEEEDEAP